MNTRNLPPDPAPFNACMRPSIPEGTMTDVEQNRLPVLLACLWARTSSRGHAGLTGRFEAATIQVSGRKHVERFQQLVDILENLTN